MKKDVIECAMERGEETTLTSIMEVKKFYDMAIKSAPCLLAMDYSIASRDGKYGFSIYAEETNNPPYIKIHIGPATGLYNYEENEYTSLWDHLMFSSRITGPERNRIEQYILSM